MTLLEQWREMAYDDKKSPQAQQMFWANYFNLEKGVYINLLKSYGEPVKGTVKELAEKYNFDIMTMVGFLPNPIETMDENTEVNLDYDLETLYKNMVDARADWLYELPEWDELIDSKRRKELYKEQKLSTTVVKGPKISRNDPCPCGSGLKYKKCCGKNA